jgi:hypothetical protein
VQMADTVIPLEALRHGLMLSGLPRNVCDGLHTRPLQTAQGAGHPSGVDSAGGRGGAPGSPLDWMGTGPTHASAGVSTGAGGWLSTLFGAGCH